MEIAHEEGREWPALGTQPRPKESRFSGCLELGLGRMNQRGYKHNNLFLAQHQDAGGFWGRGALFWRSGITTTGSPLSLFKTTELVQQHSVQSVITSHNHLWVDRAMPV